MVDQEGLFCDSEDWEWNVVPKNTLIKLPNKNKSIQWS